MNFYSGIIRKLGILLTLLFALYFVSSEPVNIDVRAAAPCCEDCPGEGDPGNIIDLCLDECNGVLFGSCYNACASAANGCYMSCVYCEQSGGGTFCTSNGDCDTWSGEYCINGFCSYSTHINLCTQSGWQCPSGSHCQWYQTGYFCVAF